MVMIFPVGRVDVVQGDCLEKLPTLDVDWSSTLVFADPPWGGRHYEDCHDVDSEQGVHLKGSGTLDGFVETVAGLGCRHLLLKVPHTFDAARFSVNTVVARCDALPLLPVEDAATDGVINRAADARAVALKAALRADFRDLGIAVPDYVHGTVDACEARRDALLLAGVRRADLVAARGANGHAARGGRRRGFVRRRLRGQAAEARAEAARDAARPRRRRNSPSFALRRR